MISAAVITAQTMLNIMIGDIRHLGSSEPALAFRWALGTAHQ
jgi:hypothetical protein